MQERNASTTLEMNDYTNVQWPSNPNRKPCGFRTPIRGRPQAYHRAFRKISRFFIWSRPPRRGISCFFTRFPKSYGTSPLGGGLQPTNWLTLNFCHRRRNGHERVRRNHCATRANTILPLHGAMHQRLRGAVPGRRGGKRKPPIGARRRAAFRSARIPPVPARRRTRVGSCRAGDQGTSGGSRSQYRCLPALVVRRAA